MSTPISTDRLEWEIAEAELGAIRIAHGIFLAALASEPNPIAWLVCMHEMAAAQHQNCTSARHAAFLARRQLVDRPMCEDASILASALYCCSEASC
jgi:hypothetical protein